jgi:hypothetical protein
MKTPEYKQVIRDAIAAYLIEHWDGWHNDPLITAATSLYDIADELIDVVMEANGKWLDGTNAMDLLRFGLRGIENDG